MTFGDFVWARYITAHRAVFGLRHGLLLCLVIGLYPRHFLSWSFAFLPGFLALMAGRHRGRP